MSQNKFKPLKTRFRATFKGDYLGETMVPPQVDKENEVLHGVQITLEGEALGHGVWLDREFCEAVAAAGNATGDVGLKVRYGHPAMCSDAIGTELGRAKNFRVVDLARIVDGKPVVCAGVLADVYILKSAHAAPQGDIAKHVLEVAAEDPKQFGQSIVFTYADWFVVDADGNRHSYKEEVEGENAKLSEDEWRAQSADGKVFVTLGKLHGSDFTDTPAATDGVFSTGTLAEEAEQMLDEHPDILAAIEKSPKAIVEFLARTGLDKRLESARLSGLQAAKDKEIAALKAQLDDMAKMHGDAVAEMSEKIESLRAETDAAKSVAETAAAEVVALQEQNAKLTSEIAEKAAALDVSAAEAERHSADAEQLRQKLGEAEKALAETQAALAAETERYRDQIGAALQQPAEELPTLQDALAKCSTPKERSALIASGKYKH